MVLYADRAAQPEEMGDADRARERDIRIHRGVLQSQTKALVLGLSNAHGLRSRPLKTIDIRLNLATKTGNQTIRQVRLVRQRVRPVRHHEYQRINLQKPSLCVDEIRDDEEDCIRH